MNLPVCYSSHVNVRIISNTLMQHSSAFTQFTVAGWVTYQRWTRTSFAAYNLL
jgi:hypothetical protein